jgi:hypothetical protein
MKDVSRKEFHAMLCIPSSAMLSEGVTDSYIISGLPRNFSGFKSSSVNRLDSLHT